MRAQEMRDAGTMAGTALDEVTATVRDTHRAVADRLFGLAGRPGAAIKAAHDAISMLAYESSRLGLKYLPPAIGHVAAALQDDSAVSAHDNPRARAVFGALSGAIGDRTAREAAAVAPEMRMRLGAGPLRRVPANVAHDAELALAAGELVTGRVVVLAHGLCETDLCWSFAAEKRWGHRASNYGTKLREDDGWTPVYLNFNTGLRISANGLELAEQLEQLVAAWPVPVTEIAVIGHSLGGLVARSAAHQGHELGHEWTHLLRHVVGLGTPHLGAPLERAVNWGMHRLARLPETRPIAALVNQRSVGIKDLRHGALLEADWLEHDPDDALDHCTPGTLIPGVAYSMVSATLSRGAHGPLAMDLLVQHGSAHGLGRTRSIPFEVDRAFTIGGGKHHFDLLADPMVYAKMRHWLNGADGAGRSSETTDPDSLPGTRTG